MIYMIDFPAVKRHKIPESKSNNFYGILAHLTKPETLTQRQRKRMAAPSKNMLLDWYRQMVLIREFEETCHQLYEEKRITGVYLHLYSGHEASGVGSMAALRKTDHVITAYRDHGIALILGMDPKALMAEMMGKKTGSSGGKGGSMHLASKDHNFWGGYAIVGGHLPLAAGIALEARYNDKDDVTMTYVGDGATNNGYFHESLNMSAIWDLPVIWIIENNGYGMGTEVERASGQTELYRKAEAYGIKSFGRSMPRTRWKFTPSPPTRLSTRASMARGH